VQGPPGGVRGKNSPKGKKDVGKEWGRGEKGKRDYWKPPQDQIDIKGGSGEQKREKLEQMKAYLRRKTS